LRSTSVFSALEISYTKNALYKSTLTLTLTSVFVQGF